MLTQISASAGSGKTYSLTRLFLSLLDRASTAPHSAGCALHCPERGYSLAEILAATFTNKAAAEMKSRIVSTLKETALHDGNKNAEVWVDRILRHYGALNIRTIDSLLVTLVRLSALELGLSPDFEPSFDAQEYFTPLYDALMDDLSTGAQSGAFYTDPFGALPGSPALVPGAASSAAVFHTTDAAHLRASLEQSCRSLITLTDIKGFTTRGRLHDLLHTLVSRFLTGKEVPLMDAPAIHARIHTLHAGMVNACTGLAQTIAAEKLNAAKLFMAFLDRCAQSPPYAAPPGGAYPQKQSLDECLNKSSQGAASDAAHAGFQRMLAAHAAFATALPLLKHALQLAPLTVLAHELYSRMQAEQRGSNLLPAIRLPLLAGQVLSGEFGVSDALCRLGARLTHLLLDEFQDTSHEQWAAILPLVVECLSTGGSLTYVGDVKQAIYSWRGGDARLFDAALHEPELLAIAPSPARKNLGSNWRSHPAIIHHNNAFFSLLHSETAARRVMEAMLPSHTPEAYLAAAAKEAARVFSQVCQDVPPARQEAMNAEPEASKGLVRLYTVDGVNSAAVENLVYGRMQRLFLHELFPLWRFGDVAVLVRSGAEATLVAEWLTQWGLPVVTENSFLLAEHPLVGRLVSFLTFLDYPLDDLAFWEFVSGQECFGRVTGLTQDALADWLAAQTRAHGKNRPALYQLFRMAFPAEWEAWIAPFHSEAGLMSAYDTLVEIISRYGLLRDLPEQTPFLQRLLEVSHLAETQGCTSLASFLAFWRTCSGDEKLPLPESMDAVRIMTMHKAKGLEFPVVVLPFHHRGKRHDPDLAAVEHDGLTLLTRATRELEDLYYPACITDELERLNLLYVAWTRPVYALHAFITRPQSSLTSSPLARGLEVLLAMYKEAAPDTLCQWEHLGGGAEAPPEGNPDGYPEEYQGDYQDEYQAEYPEEYFAEYTEPFSFEEPESESCARTAPADAAYVPHQSAGPDTVPVPLVSTPPIDPSIPWRPMEWLPRLKIYRSTLEDARFTPSRRGILAHLCLEHLMFSADDSPEQRDLDVTRAVRQGLRLFPLPVENPEAVEQEMRDCLLWFASLPEARFWLAFGLREQGIIDTAGNMHRVDLLVDEAHASGQMKSGMSAIPPGEAFLHAIDYKTGRATEQSSEEHHQQVRRYLRLLTADPFRQGRPVRGTLVYLDERRTEEVLL